MTAGLAAGTLAATAEGPSGLTTNRPNATLQSLSTSAVIDGVQAPEVVDDGWAVLFAVDESAEGADRNGDGDTSDRVLHVLDVGTGALPQDQVLNLGLALSPESMFVTGDEATALFVDEAAQGSDLNGDGDTDDTVLHTWDDRAAEVANSGLAVALDRLPQPARPIGTATFTAVVPEAAQGADLNGDGDLDDHVLHVWEPRRARVTSTGRAYSINGLYGASGLPGYAPLDAARLAFVVDEATDGRDANGDGDTTDGVVHVLDVTNGEVDSLGIAAHAVHDAGAGLLAIEADEVATGRDLDGDGAVDGHPVLVTDGTPAGTSATGVQARPEYDVMAERVAPAGSGVVALVPRIDGEPDPLLRYDVASGALVDTGARTQALLPAAGDRVVFGGATADSSGLHVLEPDGTVVAAGVGGHLRLLTDALVAVSSFPRFGPEEVTSVVDVTTGEQWVPQLHLRTWGAAAVRDGRIAARAVEHDDGPFHAMLDGDAMTGEELPAVWDLGSGRIRTLDVGTLGSWPTGDGDAVAAVDEATTGDLNGDGDASDTVLVRARFGAPGDTAGPVLDVVAREVAPGQVGLDVAAGSTDGTPLVALGAQLEDGARDALTPSDGVYDAADETFSRAYAATAGQTICVDALDADGDRNRACATIGPAPPDETAPVVRDVTVTPSVVHPGDDIQIEAIIDDSDTGGSSIADAWVAFNGDIVSMDATEPPSDSSVERYAATVTAPDTYGEHELCVAGSDDDGNTADPYCLTVEVRDLQGPAVTAMGATPDPVEEGEPLVLRATLDDRETGGSAIADATLSVDGTPVDTQPRDGVFDSVVEEVEAFLDHATGPGDHELCVTATDTAGARSSGACIAFTVVAGEGPLVRDVNVQPPTVGLHRSVTLSAVIDDTETGGSVVSGASYTIDGMLFGQLGTDVYDEPIEWVSTSVDGFSTPGTRALCVTGYDRNGNASAEPGCVTLTVVDDVAPVISALEVPGTVEVGDPIEVTATADDSGAGGSVIARMEAAVDGGPATALAATDGSFDQAIEEATATLPGIDAPGDHEVCVRAADAAGNVTDTTCATVRVVDTRAPIVGDLVLPSEPVVAGEPFTFTFTADDTATGGAVITSARATVAGGPGSASTAPVDGALDEPYEQVTGTVQGTREPGVLQVCVHATDAYGNQAEPLCDTVTVVDDVAPVISALEVPGTVEVGAPIQVTATADDSAAGGSAIARMEAAVDGGPAMPLAATDGSFDQAVEEATATLPGIDAPGDHEVCVRAADAAGNVTDTTCATLRVVDTRAPIVGDLVLPSEPVVAGEPFTFTFTADDTATGGAVITSARATVAGGPGSASTAPVDGALDEPHEQVTGTVEGTQEPGVLQVCVHATDAYGNQAEPLCDVVTVVGRSVTGSGSIPSSVSPLSEDATFDLDVRETADGIEGTLTYTDGPWSFVATSFTDLSTDDSTVGHVSGRGTLFGLLTCDFSLTADEGAHGSPEPGGLAFSVSACGVTPGAVYDSGPVQALTSGAITVRGG